MTKKELLKKLKEIEQKNGDHEKTHVLADVLILQYINDPEITELHAKLSPWYA